MLVEAKGFGSGTGVYIQDSNFLYFATALHVLYNYKTDVAVCDSIRLITYRENTDVDKPDTLLLDFCTAYKKGFAQIDIKNDVLIVKLAEQKKLDSLYKSLSYYPHATRIGRSTKINSWNTGDIISIDSLDIGSDVFIFGYPKSLSLQFSFDYNRPLLRKGVIAGRDLKKNRIILDCPAYQGNSGGPAFSIMAKNFMNYQVTLLGIISEFIPFEEHWYNDKYQGVTNIQISNSGYTVLVPIGSVLNLISKLK